jgi:ATP-binding cassette subfamily B protein
MAIRTRPPAVSRAAAAEPVADAPKPPAGDGVFWATLRRMLVFTQPYRFHLWASLVLAVLSQVAALSIPWLTGAAIDDAIRPRDETALTLLIGLIVAAGVIRLVLMVLRRLITGRMAVDIEQDLRNILYEHMQRLSFSFYDTHQTGQLMSRATADLGAVRIFLSYGLLFFSQHAITIATVVLLLLFTDPLLALVALATTPALIGLAARYSRRSHPLVTDAQQKLADVTTQAEENVVGVRVVKAFGQEARETARFRHASERVFTANLRANRQRAIYIPLMAFVPSLAVAAVLLAGGYRVIEGDLTLGEFVRFNLLLAMMVGPLRMIGMWIGQAQRAISSAVRVFEVLDEEPTIADRPGARPLPPGGGAIRMEGVTFGYDTARPILDGIDLDVAAGSTVALIGPTGCGKTTLTTLIPRFYDVTEGRVLIDGVDVRDVTLDSLRGAIGIVSEETFLFSTTVRENIAYGAPWATDADVRRAAERAQAAEFIEALPDGYETTVGERGLTLSGGQRQRIAIARALLVDPRILILDDATASVDASTEARIKRALTEVMEGRTTIIIAHRLSTISLADRIVVLDQGRIVADGDAARLLDESPVFREIHDHGLLERTFVDLDGDRVITRDEADDNEPAQAARRGSRLT